MEYFKAVNYLPSLFFSCYYCIQGVSYTFLVHFRETLGWLKSQQDPDGCFAATGMVHNKKIRGGYINTGAPSKTAITAYVVAALLEAGESRYVSRIFCTNLPLDSFEMCTHSEFFHVNDKKICSHILSLKVSEFTQCSFGVCFKDPNVDNGIRCLDNAIPEDVYSLALVAYAYSVYDVRNLKRTDCLDKLEDIAITEGVKLKYLCISRSSV